jgi:hypothetical protein
VSTAETAVAAVALMLALAVVVGLLMGRIAALTQEGDTP